MKYTENNVVKIPTPRVKEKPLIERKVLATQLILVYKNFNDRRALEKLKDQDCIEFVLSLDRIVSNEKIAKTKNWVSENWMFNLWDKPTHLGEGLPVGRMKCGATAIIIEKENDDYKIFSPYDESIGWINKKQISFTFYQNPKTQKPCDQITKQAYLLYTSKF